jgi:hypothetical protein
MAPADSPQLKGEICYSVECPFMLIETYMVTLVGSPPKALMYFCTHRSANRSTQVFLAIYKSFKIVSDSQC